MEVWEKCWITIISFLFAFAAFLIGIKLKLDYSAKLLGITFVLGKDVCELSHTTTCISMAGSQAISTHPDITIN